MLKSMTGFGRCENATDEYKISVEMKAVNHRYLDLSIKMPKKFNYFEAAIRTLLKKYIQRGKVDLFINYEDYTEGNLCLKYNRILAGEYMEYFRKMEEEFGIRNDIQVSAFDLLQDFLVGPAFCHRIITGIQHIRNLLILVTAFARRGRNHVSSGLISFYDIRHFLELSRTGQ